MSTTFIEYCRRKDREELIGILVSEGYNPDDFDIDMIIHSRMGLA